MRVRELWTLGVVVGLAGTLLAGCPTGGGVEGDDCSALAQGTEPEQEAKLADPAGAALDAIGSVVALSGDTAVVGAPEFGGGGFGRGKVLVFRRSTTETEGSWELEATLTPSDPMDFASFGYSVDIDGDTIVVGANGWSDNEMELPKGALYVFTRSTTESNHVAWTERTRLSLGGDAAFGDFLGDSVAIDGDTIVAGVSSKDDFAGRTYVFTGSGATWSAPTALPATGLAGGDFLGITVAIDGDTILAGASQFLSGPGKVLVFFREEGVWAQQGDALAGADSEGAALTGTNAQFGYGLSVAGDLALIGAPGDFDRAGAAYVFARSGTDWSQQAILVDDREESTAADGDGFGWSVAIEGDTAIVAAPGVDSGKGSGFWFGQENGTWSLFDVFAPEGGAAMDAFGSGVAFEQGLAIVGSPGSDAAKGAAYAFLGVTPDPECLQTILELSEAANDDRFGSAVFYGRGTLLVGAPGAEGGKGAVVVLARSGSEWSEQARLTATDGAAGDRFGTALDFFGDTLVIGAPANHDGSPGSAYVYERVGSSWVFRQKLTVPEMPNRSRFGNDVAVDADTIAVGAYWEPYGELGRGGAVYVFGRSGETWEQRQRIAEGKSLPLTEGSEFGQALDLSGGRLAIAHGVALYPLVYERRDGVFSIDTTFPTGTLGLIASIAVSGNTVVAGRAGGTGSGAGDVTVFVRDESGWTKQATVEAFDGFDEDWFGRSVALEGGMLVVGAPAFDRINDPGGAYVFLRSDGQWRHEAKYSAGIHYITMSVLDTPKVSPDGGDDYGAAVGVFGGTIIAGIPGEDSDKGILRTIPPVAEPAVSRGSLISKKVKTSTKKTVIKGVFDTGGGDLDCTSPGTFEIGDFVLDGADFSVSDSGASATTRGHRIAFVCDKDNCARGKVSIVLSGDLSDRIPSDGPLHWRFTNDKHVMTGSVTMARGKSVKAGVTDPGVFPKQLKVKFNKDGSGKSYKAQLGFLTDGEAPTTAPTARLLINGRDSGETFCEPGKFVLKGAKWSCNEDADEYTSKVSIDYKKGIIKVGGKFGYSIDQALPNNAESATLDLTLILGETIDNELVETTYRTSFQVVRKGNAIEY